MSTTAALRTAFRTSRSTASSRRTAAGHGHLADDLGFAAHGRLGRHDLGLVEHDRSAQRLADGRLLSSAEHGHIADGLGFAEHGRFGRCSLLADGLGFVGHDGFVQYLADDRLLCFV